MTDIVMPRLSDSMEEGLILRWLIEDGHPVEVGDELLEIETDKATMTWEAETSGVLSIVTPAGETAPVGEVIARLVGPEEAPGDPTASTRQTPVEEPATAETPLDPTPLAAPIAAVSSNGGRSDQPLVTPVARRLAAQRGVTLSSVHGTGPGGRITKADVLGAAGEPPASIPEPSSPARAEELTRTQRQIARRMAEAKATIPHFQVQTEVVMDAPLALRAEIKHTVADGELIPSINDLIVRASALALRAHSRANGSYREDRFELHDRVGVGVAVATEDALIVPTVLDADSKSLMEIAVETRRLADRVRSGEITPSELSGATFTVSNLGMYGVTAITPVVNPPQAAILGVGAIRQVLARDDDQIVDRSVLTLTLSCDHRILYGADAAQFLGRIKRLLEQPLTLLL
jgi:pyruvate dehydrogenase E2 component (dihydrolipoamide acetyltransferase)